MKKKLLTLFIFVTTLILLSCYIFFNDNLRFKFSYEFNNLNKYTNNKSIKINIPLKNNIRYNNNVIKEFKRGTKIIYFGYSTCPWCRRIVKPLIDSAKKYNIEIVYINVKNKNFSAQKKEISKLLDEYLIEENNQKKFYVPNVFFIKEGKIIGNHLSVVESYENPFVDLTSNQRNELINIYNDYIERMIK